MTFITKDIAIAEGFTKVGEAKEYTTVVPLRGWDSLTSISYTATGEVSPAREFDVKFRYSQDAVRFSEWIDLDNFSAVTIELKSDFILEFGFTRSGPDPTGTLILDEINLEGNFEQSYYDLLADVLEDTIFEEVGIENERWNALWINLLRKFYYKGVLPDYIERGEETNYEDDDLIAFWKVVSYFLAFAIELGTRKIGEYDEDEQLLNDYLAQFSFLNCPNQTLADLQYIMENAFDEIRQRGTKQIQEEAGMGTPTKVVNGELLRYICYKPTDEFMFEYLPRHLSGWTLDKSCPMIPKVGYTEQVNKAPVMDATGIWLYGGNALYNWGEESGVKTFTFENDASTSNRSELIFLPKIDPHVNYEFSFKIKAPTGASFDVDIQGSDAATFPVILERVTDFTNTTLVVENGQLADPTKWYHFKCIVYALATEAKTTKDGYQTSIGQGVQLRCTQEDIAKLQVMIRTRSLTGEVKIQDIKFKPLHFCKASPNYIDAYNVANVYLVNRNSTISVIELEENVRRYLLPYGTILQICYSPFSEFTGADNAAFIQQENFGYLTQEGGGKIKILT